VNNLTMDGFEDFFRALHGHPPYPWQQRLAKRAVGGNWPGAIDLPTGSGKTACIDIAIFALACQASQPVEQRTSPRRIFFCVNRRVIVDEAHQRAQRIAERIWKAERAESEGTPILRNVAAALRKVAGTTGEDSIPPLDVLELRGGIYRDNRWARSITQPTIVCTTIDQLGSRLLFRGYGVSPNAAPIQAALIAFDGLILLDEAHISEPFRQTLEHVRRYLDPEKWAEQAIGVRPACVVPMTATPNDEMRQNGVIQLDDEDRDSESLNRRLAANKPAELRQVSDIARDAVKEALEAAAKGAPVSVGIIVNRVATAKAIHDQLREMQREPSEKKRKVPTDATLELVIGSMRPVDRDQQAKRLRAIVGPARPPVAEKTSFIVATQCLEVGADYDFDVLITECASLDALRQRFGRLNRAGRVIEARAVILANKKDIKEDDKLDDDKPLDPIYGNALARTWNWLNKHASEGVIDFGIDAFKNLLDKPGDSVQPSKELLAPSASLNAPVMMPAYVDFWCQTAPRPTPDPDVSLFIHGPQGGEPDVQVCWRADLVEDGSMATEDWCDTVALLSPTSAECMSLPISRVRRWLADQRDKTQDHGDVLGVCEGDEQGKDNHGDHKPAMKHHGVLWRGLRDSKLIASPDDLRPGDTLVLPAWASDSRVLGHFPEPDHAQSTAAGETEDPHATAIHDVAETAFTRARDLAALRLHPRLRFRLPAGEAFDDLFAASDSTKRDEPPTRREWSAMLQAAANAIPDDQELKQTLGDLGTNRRQIEPYPDERGVVLTTRRRLNTSTRWFIRPMDEGDDETSRSQRDAPITLDDHTQHVLDAVLGSLKGLPLGSLTEAHKLAARFHDLGKADERFQAMLRRTDRTDAWLLAGVSSALLAKSDGVPTTPSQREGTCVRAGLPAGFRHEMLAVQLAESSGNLPDDASTRDLVLHLIAAHHGHARPFAPVVPDDELPPVEVGGTRLTHEQRALLPPHRLDSGIAERFWTLTRRFGWWGLAYLEAVLRLADQQASAAEDVGKYDNEHTDEPAEVST
jgi:CRISPR-associated endonuclease/helicase Cas3